MSYKIVVFALIVFPQLSAQLRKKSTASANHIITERISKNRIAAQKSRKRLKAALAEAHTREPVQLTDEEEKLRQAIEYKICKLQQNKKCLPPKTDRTARRLARNRINATICRLRAKMCLLKAGMPITIDFNVYKNEPYIQSSLQTMSSSDESEHNSPMDNFYPSDDLLSFCKIAEEFSDTQQKMN